MINRLLILTLFVALPLKSAELSSKDILAKNNGAVVQIIVNGEFHGTGFIISKDGLIATANHVITTKESGYTEASKKIEVRIPNSPRLHFARPAIPITTTSKVHDVAILRVEVIDLPCVELGELSEVEQGNSVTVIGFVPGLNQSLLLTGIVSAKTEDVTVIDKQAYRSRIAIFEIPVRGGVSGSPIFSNATGRVVGVVTTKVYGISQQLDETLSKLNSVGEVTMVGSTGASVGINKTLAGLIGTLEENLVSGLGSAVNISYVKEMKAEAEKAKK